MSSQQKYSLYLEFAKLIEAGFGINDAADALLDAKQDAAVRLVLEELKGSLKEGRSITAALAEGPMELLEMEESILSAGERGGRLAVAFQQLGEYFELLADSSREIRRGFIYPTILFHFAVLLSVIPFSLLDGGMGKSGGEIIADFVVKLLLCYGVGFLLFLGCRKLLRRASGSAAIDWFLGRIPLVGKARKSFALARFVNVYQGGISSGLSMHETVKIATSSAHSGMIREAGAELSETVKEGQPLGSVFQKYAVFPVAFSRAYVTAEKSGSLDSDLNRWGKRFAKEAKSSAETVTKMLPKAFYVLVVAYIGWRIISVYLGYYDGLEEIMEGDL